MPETLESMRLWRLVGGQQRIVPSGKVYRAYALDLAAVATVFQAIGVPTDRMDIELEKMNLIFVHTRGKA